MDLGRPYPGCSSPIDTRSLHPAHPPKGSPKAVQTGGGGSVGRKSRAVQGCLCSPAKALLLEKQTKVRPLQVPRNSYLQPTAWGHQLPRLCLKAKGAGWPLTNGHMEPVVRAGGGAVQEAYTSNSALQLSQGPGSQDLGDSRAQLWQKRGPSPGSKGNAVGSEPWPS